MNKKKLKHLTLEIFNTPNLILINIFLGNLEEEQSGRVGGTISPKVSDKSENLRRGCEPRGSHQPGQKCDKIQRENGTPIFRKSTFFRNGFLWSRGAMVN